MKSIIFALFCAILSPASAAELRQIEGVSGDVDMVRFDSDYIYAISSGPVGLPYFSKFYKINSEKKLVWATHWDGKTRNLIINRESDIYSIVDIPPSDATVNILRNGSKTFEELDRVAYPIYDFVDGEENLFYISGSGGIRMIRSNETEPIDIANTDNFRMYDNSQFSKSVSSDQDGNIYFGGCINGGNSCKNETREFQLIVITAEEKRKEIPTAQVIDNVLQDPKNEYIIQILASKREYLLISTFNGKTEIGNIKKLNNGTITVLYSDEGQQFGKEAGDRIIYQTMKRDPQVIIRCNITYLTLNDEFVPVSNLQDFGDFITCPVSLTNPDEEGNLFIGSSEVLDTSPLEFLNHTESESIGVNFEGQFDSVAAWTLDSGNNLWLLDGGDFNEDYGFEIFYVETGSLKGVKVLGGNVSFLWDIVRNNNDEIFVYGLHGLYVIES